MISDDEDEDDDLSAKSMRVLFQTPGGTDSLQTDVSTKGLTSTHAVLQKLGDVFCELHGQWLPAEQLLVQYQDAQGNMVYLHSSSSIRDLFAARRILVSARRAVDTRQAMHLQAQAPTNYAF